VKSAILLACGNRVLREIIVKDGLRLLRPLLGEHRALDPGDRVPSRNADEVGRRLGGNIAACQSAVLWRSPRGIAPRQGSNPDMGWAPEVVRNYGHGFSSQVNIAR
jgi:hypothetical protein